jgi:competence protein ComEA
MARARNLLWLSAFAGLVYVVWRWRTKQAEATPLPAYTPPPTPPAVAPPRPASSAEAPATRAGETTGTPRRIPTRVHRGAPPTPAGAPGAADTAPAAPAEPDTPPEPPPAAVALEAAVGAETPADEGESEAAEGIDLAPLVGAEAEAAEGVDLAPLVGAEAAGDVVDLAPLVGAEAAETEASFSGAQVNLNTADLDALVALPGIGQALARRIIAYREEHGPFSSVEQLVDVQGIGERNLDEFRHLITV